MCHSDEHLVTGDMARDPRSSRCWAGSSTRSSAATRAPASCVEVGPGVTELAVGDHVVTSFIPSCGKCPSCATGHQNLCDLGAHLLSGHQLDGTFRHHPHDGSDLATMCCLGTFAEHSVLNQARW